MSDLSYFQGANVTEISQLSGLSRGTLSKVMTAYTQRGKTSSAKQNRGRKEKLSKRRVLKRIIMSKKRTTVVRVTAKLIKHLYSLVSIISLKVPSFTEHLQQSSDSQATYHRC
ncbi:hypothetical protein TNCV_4702941 [Trichonephila clavipes]|nr:hypothetical protein TNCV_4702941 [Trichonephila clavipes]